MILLTIKSDFALSIFRNINFCHRMDVELMPSAHSRYFPGIKSTYLHSIFGNLVKCGINERGKNVCLIYLLQMNY
jgi:hypothetical protein